jgi:hypothetical protein
MSKYLKALTHVTIQEIAQLAEERRTESGEEDVEGLSGLILIPVKATSAITPAPPLRAR